MARPLKKAPQGEVDASDALTAREEQILLLRAGGLTSAQVAARLGTSKRTVDFHSQNAYEKLGVHSFIQALNALKDRDALP